MTTTMTDEFQTLPLAAIVSSLTNPRKSFRADKLTELAASILASGVHQPILVRPLPGSRVADTDRGVTHEIVAGERRYRASVIADMPTIPALIRQLTDEQVLEIQLVENLERDDLTELEEAEGYQRLMEHSNLNADAIAGKMHKSRSYVYGRLKLLDLTMECKEAMRAGLIDASRAISIARIPDTTLQTKALAEATREDYRGDVPSVRAFQAWLQVNVMLRLDKAAFKITDARLVQAAGSCSVCPKRTGANPDLFLDVSNADICTDPACYHGKEEAHRNMLRKKAEAKGMRIVDGEEAKEMVPHQYTDSIKGYSHLGRVRDDIVAADGTTGHTLRQLLGADAPAPILFEHPYTKELIEAVPTDEAEGVLLAKGLLKATPNTKPKGTTTNPEYELKQLQSLAERDTKKAVQNAYFNATVQAIRTTSDAAAYKLLNPALLRAWLVLMLDISVQTDYMAKALGYTFQVFEDKQDGLVMHINACSGADLYRAAAIVMMEEDDYSSYNDQEPTVLNAAMDTLGIDTKDLAKTATAAVRAEYAERLKAVKNQLGAQKPVTNSAPAAQADTTRGGTPTDGAKPKLKTPAARKPKLSSEEAKSGIAQAMQNAERAPTASPEAQQGDQASGQVDLRFVEDQRVRVTTDDNKLGSIWRKWAGKEGTVTKTNVDHDPDFYDVTFKGRNGGLATFRTDQLEGVVA